MTKRSVFMIAALLSGAYMFMTIATQVVQSTNGS
jgi:hypothetical protein